jgi:beta-barrel assembly-enhancing protease
MSAKLLLFLLVSVAAAAQEREYSKEKEALLGAQIAKEVRRETTILENDGARDYVRRLGSLLVSHVPGDAPAFIFDVIVNNGPPSQIHEPVWIPGGYVFVRAGLFLAARDEAEFAGMLAHAIAHVAQRHGRGTATPNQVNLTSIPLIFTGSWTVTGHDTIVPVGFLKFARAWELAADKLAVQIMATAGYDPAALLRYIDRMQVDPTEPRRAYSAMPLREERLTALQESVSALPPRTFPENDSFMQVREEVRRLLDQPLKPRRAPSLRGQTPEQP